MYGLPQNINLDFLLNKQLIQACFGICEVILHFDGETSITLECNFAVTRLSDDDQEIPASSLGSSGILKLLGTQIIGLVNNGGSELKIIFSNQYIIIIYDSNSDYESFQITHPSRTIVV